MPADLDVAVDVDSEDWSVALSPGNETRLRALRLPLARSRSGPRRPRGPGREPDVAAVAAHDAARDGEPEPAPSGLAAARCFEAHEGLEHPLQFRLGDPRALVLDDDAGQAAAVSSCAALKLAMYRCERTASTPTHSLGRPPGVLGGGGGGGESGNRVPDLQEHVLLGSRQRAEQFE